MIIKSTTTFEKSFRELSRSDQQLVRETIFFFRECPHHPALRNHPLGRSMRGKRSISVTDDMRIIFTEQ